MVEKATNQSMLLHVGLILFDETHSRVFAVRGPVIADAREFTVDETSLTGRSRVPRRFFSSDQAHERAARTALLVIELHDSHPFDCLLVAGPAWARALVWQHLPAHLRVRLAGSLKLPVMAGESAILDTALPTIEAILRKSSYAALRRVAVATTAHKAGSAGPAESMAAVGTHAQQQGSCAFPLGSLPGDSHKIAMVRY